MLLRWNKVVTSIHNLASRRAYNLSNNFILGVWNNIARVKSELVKRDIPMSAIIRRTINYREETLFWSDDWLGNGPLKLRFPKLYTLESQKKCKISDHIYDGGFSWSWSRQPLSQQVNRLIQAIGSTWLNSSKEYSQTCDLASNDCFVVDVGRRRLKTTLSGSGNFSFVWLKETPIKVSCFVWRAIQNCIPSALALNHRGINTDLVTCGECNTDEESADHIICGCSFARFTWEWIFIWCFISLPYFDKTGEVLEFATVWGNCPKKKKVLLGICYGTIWSLWQARNGIIFNQNQITPEKAVDIIKSPVFIWFKRRSNGGIYNWIDWCKSPSCNRLDIFFLSLMVVI
ncbi:hypothetical protein Lser_V15G02675 [Lactuca serriola]